MCVLLVLYAFGYSPRILIRWWSYEFLQRAGYLFWHFGSDWVKRVVEGNVSH